MKTSREKQAVLMMAVCAALWSTAGIFIKLIPWHSMVICGLRSLLSAAVVFLYMKHQKIPIRLTKRSGLASLTLALTFICFVIANKLTTAANAIVLEFTSPIFILIMNALVFHQKIRHADALVVGVTMCGITLFFFDQLGNGSLLGNLLGVFCGFCVACTYAFFGQSRENERMSGILLGLLISGIVGLPFAFWTPMEITAQSVLTILALGIFQLGIPYVLFGLATGDCPPLACNLIGAIEPLLNPIWVFLFNGEKPGTFALIGSVIVIFAVTGWCILQDHTLKREQQS